MTCPTCHANVEICRCAPSIETVTALRARIIILEAKVAAMRDAFEQFRTAFGSGSVKITRDTPEFWKAYGALMEAAK